MATTIKFKKATAADWTSNNPVLASGEPGIETDTSKMKIGNGTQAWDVLTYVNEAPYSLSFGPTITRTYEGDPAVARHEMGLNLGISGDKDVISVVPAGLGNSPYDAQINVYNSDTGVLERSITNPNSDYKFFSLNNLTTIMHGGDYIAVGASAITGNSRKVTIHQISTGSLIHTIDDANPNNNSWRYRYNSISDNYLVSSDWQNESIDIRKTTAGDWSDITTVGTVNSPSSSTRFGENVSIHGDYAIVSGRFYTTGSIQRQGRAFIVNLNTATVVDTIENPAPGPNNYDYFGQTVNFIDANTVAVGAASDDTTGSNSGSVYIFRSANGSWNDTTLVQTLANPNVHGSSDDDNFGRRLHSDGNYLLVGAESETTDEFPTNGRGAVYMYETTNGNWDDLSVVYTYQNPTTGNTTNPGTEVEGLGAVYIDVAQNRILISHPNSDVTSYDSGRVYQLSIMS